jgi:hypothetical protein
MEHMSHWEARQRSRFMRPDGERYVRPDAYRFVRPDAHRFFRPDVETPSGKVKAAWERAGSAIAAEVPTSIPVVRRLTELLRKAGFNPDQLRVPAGNPDGGQWTDDESSDWIRVAQNDKTLTDAYGNPYYSRGGHHEMPKSVFQKWKLRPETRKVFDEATSGTVPTMSLRSSPDSNPLGHIWNGPTGPHGVYNEAVTDLSDRFLERNGITDKQMTPDQARALLKEIRESEDPRIRNYNNAVRMIRRLFRLRIGGGNE